MEQWCNTPALNRLYKRCLCVVVQTLPSLCSGGHHERYSTTLWAFHTHLFSLHLHGRVQDFVAILMDLWPRFGVYVCVFVCECVWCVCQSYQCQLKKHIDGGRGAEQKCSASKNICHMNFLTAWDYSFLGKKWSEKEALLMNVHVYNNLSLIYAFMKGLLQKLLCLKKQRAEKSDRQKQENGGLITDNHVMT